MILPTRTHFVVMASHGSISNSVEIRNGGGGGHTDIALCNQWGHGREFRTHWCVESFTSAPGPGNSRARMRVCQLAQLPVSNCNTDTGSQLSWKWNDRQLSTQFLWWIFTKWNQSRYSKALSWGWDVNCDFVFHLLLLIPGVVILANFTSDSDSTSFHR